MTIWSHEDPVPGFFNDGAFPVDRAVLVRQAMGELIIEDKATGDVLAKWPLGTLRPVPDAEYPSALRLRQIDGEGGRLAILDRAFNEGLTEWWPGLRRRLILDRATLRIAGRISLAAVLGFGIFFLALLPVLGQLAAYLVPPSVEERTAGILLRHGSDLSKRIQSARVCDTSQLKPLLTKLVEPLREASGWPSEVRIRVIDERGPMAAALPGGEIVLFNGILQFAQSADEVAGILAHELGHISERHTMRNLFTTGLNYFGFDQLLGDFSGQLVVHPMSGVLLSTWATRRAESQADRAAVKILTKAGYRVRPLADFLDRIAYTQGEQKVAEGWLATHPLSVARARMIRELAPDEPRPPVLTMAEFGRLRAVCSGQTPGSPDLPAASSADAPESAPSAKGPPADAANAGKKDSVPQSGGDGVNYGEQREAGADREAPPGSPDAPAAALAGGDQEG